MNKKFLFIFALAVFLLIPLSSAGLFQSNKVFDKTHRLDLYQKQFLKEQKIEKFKEYGRYEIHDSKFLGLLRGDLTQDFVLLSSDNSIINAYAILEVTNYRPETLLDTLKFKGGTPRDIKYSYYVTENKQVKVQDYKQVCSKPKISLTRFKTNSTNSTNTKTCKQVKNGFHYKTETNSYWKTYNGQLMPKGKYKLKIDGKLEAVNKKTDWILSKGNYDLDKWTWWNNSWSKKREISGLTGDLSYLSTITYDADMNADFSDLRFTNFATESIELNYTPESYENGSGLAYSNLSTDLTTNLISYWKLDETSGTLTDSKGGYTLTNTGATSTTGKINNAYSFISDGTDYLNSATSPSITGSWTISTWLYRTSALNDDFSTIIDIGNYGANNGFGIWSNIAGDIDFRINQDINHYTTDGSVNTKINTWEHIIITYDGSNIKIYKNGLLGKTITFSTNPIAVTNYIQFAKRTSAGSWGGKIDEVALWNISLTQSQVLNLYKAQEVKFRLNNKGESSVMMYYGNAGATSTSSASDVHFNPVSYYYLDESSGTTATDSVGTNDGTNVNGVLVNQAGKIGTAYDFDGVDDYVTTPLNFGDEISTTTFSFSFWFNADTSATLQHEDTILSTEGPVDPVFNIWIGANAISIYTAGTGPIFAEPYTIGNWINVVLTYDDSNFRLYKDGILKGTVAYTGDLTSNNLLNFGRSERTNSRFIDGKMDEVAIYNRALTSTEVSKLYNYTSPSFVTGAEQNSNQLTINQNSPINTFNSSSSTIAFDCNATDETGVLSLNLTINDTVYQTVTGNGSTNLTLTSNEVLSDGFYEWYCTTNDDTITLNTSTRTLTVDTTPFIEFISPTPANNTQLATSVIPVYVNISTPYFSNVTYYLHNEDTGANFTQFYNTQIENYNWTGLSTGHYDFYVQINTTTGQSNQTELRHTEHDIDAPNISVTSPVSEDFIVNGDTLNLNWTTSDLNPDTCWYNYNSLNTTVTCSANTTTFNYVAGQNTLTFYANDTFGNENNNITNWEYNVIEKEITYNNQTIEGSIETFVYNFTKLSSKTLSKVEIVYDGSTYSTTLSSSGNNILSTVNLTIPTITADINKTFYFVVTFSDSSTVNSTISTQLIKNLGIDTCSSYTNKIYEFTLYDEELQTNITTPPTENTTIELDLKINEYGTTTQVLNITHKYSNINPAQVCLNLNLSTTKYSVDGVLKYSGDLHSIEYYNIQGFTLEQSAIPQSINLYDLKLVDSTEFKITFKDDNYLPLAGALILFNRQYVSEGVFKTVEIPKTDTNGQTVAHLDEKNVIYNIIVTKDGEILSTLENIVSFCTDITTGLCEINLQQSTTTTQYFNYDSQFLINYNAEYNQTSRDLSFTFSTKDGGVKNVSIDAFKFDMLGSGSVCSTSLSSASGTMICTIPSTIGDTLMTLDVYVDGVFMNSFSVDGKTQKPYGSNGYFIFLILFATIIMMLSSSKTMLIIGSIVGFLIAGLLSLQSTGTSGVVVSVVYLAIAGFILIWKMNNSGRDQ